MENFSGFFIKLYIVYSLHKFEKKISVPLSFFIHLQRLSTYLFCQTAQSFLKNPLKVFQTAELFQNLKESGAEAAKRCYNKI
jgi:hypothetical protein